MQELLGPINKRIVDQAIDALQKTDGERLGGLMVEAQAFFDRYAAPACPEELTAPELHRVLDYEPLKPHIWGGKGVGSQGDGTAQFIARSQADQQAVIEILRRDLGLTGLELTLRPSVKVRKAVIPAAGFGTRLFPASKATKKELFPIIDKDGIAKPAILLIVEEALEAGIEEIIIIVQEDDLNDFESFFKSQISIENYQQATQAFPGLLSKNPGDRAQSPICCSDNPGGIWSRDILHTRSGWKRTLPSNVRRPPLPLKPRTILLKAAAGRISAAWDSI